MLKAKRPVFVSTSIYALAHQLGMKGAIEEFKRQLDSPTRDSLPVVRTLTRLRNLETELHLHVDAGATIIAQARTRAMHEAAKTGLPWISLDDDIECTLDVAAAMLEVLHEPVPRIVLVPYLTRDEEEEPRLTITLPLVRVERIAAGARLLTMPRGAGAGFGMVGMNASAIAAVLGAAPIDLWWFDRGERKLAVFREELAEGLWLGEDTSFFKRIPESVSVEAILTGTVVHGQGAGLDLGKL